MSPARPTVCETLEIRDLSKVYSGADGPVGGVREASFTLESGTFFTLLGPSGCGKTTTLRSIAGLETPDTGSIHLGERVFFDADVGVNVPLHLRQIGMVFQSYAIWPHMTVFENVAFPLRVSKQQRYDRAQIKRMVDSALDTVSLGGFQNRSATRLSGGQQQRVALARAIVRQPRLLLLDEPLSNLDASLREEMRTELKRLQQQIGVTTIYVTHDHAEALDMSDRIAVLNGGRIVQIGAPRDIYFRPQSSFVAGFVGATNLVHGTVQSGCGAEAVAPVRLADGQVLRCLFPRPAAASARIVVSIRPEAMTLTEADVPRQHGWNRMEGMVATSGFLGNLNRYGIRVGDALMHVNTGPEAVFPVGATVGLHFSGDGAVALPD